MSIDKENITMLFVSTRSVKIQEIVSGYSDRCCWRVYRSETRLLC